MSSPTPITESTPIGPDVDLKRDDVRLKDGTRLTGEVADEIVDQLRRSSLSGQATASPQIVFRVPSAVRDRAAEVAAREGKTILQLAREALEDRIATSQ